MYKKIIGIFVCNNLTNVLNLDRKLYENLYKEFKNLYIIDLSLIYNFKLEKKPEYYKTFRPKTLDELDKFLNNNLNIFFNHVPRQLFFLKFHILINKKNLINIDLNLGNSIQLNELYYKKNNYGMILKKKINRAIYKILGVFNVVKTYDYLFISTKKIKKYYRNKRDNFFNKFFFTKKFFKHKNIIFVNDKIFDLSKNIKKTKKYIVYIDTPLSKNGNDVPMHDLPSSIQKEKFYNNLVDYLYKLSEKYRKKVIICLHPKTNNNEIKKKFKYFICKKFSLWKYLNQAFLVTCIASTTISYAIYNKKKILIFSSSNLGKYQQSRASVLSKSYKINMVNLDNKKEKKYRFQNKNSRLKILKKNIVLEKKESSILRIIKIIKKI